MPDRLHPSISSYLSRLTQDHSVQTERTEMEIFIRNAFPSAANDPQELADLLSEVMGRDDNNFAIEHAYVLSYETEPNPKTEKLRDLFQMLQETFSIRFPNTYQGCAFLLLLLFPDRQPGELLNRLQPDYLYFELTEGDDDEDSPGYAHTDLVTSRLVVDWCPHNVLTNNETIKAIIENYKNQEEDVFEISAARDLYHYFGEDALNDIPSALKEYDAWEIGEWIELLKISVFREKATGKLVEAVLSRNYPFHYNGQLLKAFSPHQPYMMKRILSCNGMLLDELPESLRDKEELVSAALQDNGEALNMASPRIQKLEPFIKQALTTTPKAILYLNDEIRNDVKWISYAIAQEPALLSKIDITELDALTQKETAERAIHKNPLAIALLPDWIRKQDTALFARAMALDHRSIIFAWPTDKITDDQIENALLNCPLLFRDLSESVRGDIRFIRLVLEKEPLLYQYLPESVKVDPNIAALAFQLNPSSFLKSCKYVVPDPTSMRKLIETNAFLVDATYFSSHYATEPDLVDQYLKAVFNKRNGELQKVLDIDRAFKARLEKLNSQLMLSEINLGAYNDVPF